MSCFFHLEDLDDRGSFCTLDTPHALSYDVQFEPFDDTLDMIAQASLLYKTYNPKKRP